MEVFKFYNLFVFLQLSAGFSLANKSSEGELVKKLLSNYEKHGRPVLSAKEPVNVTIGATLLQIQEVDTEEDTITTNVWLNLEWRDEFLSWNASQAKGIEDLRLDIEDIWVPDIDVYNLVSRKGLREREQVVLKSSGLVTWVPPYILTTTCKLDLTWFPFDRQECIIQFGSWTNNGWKIDVQMKWSLGMDLSNFVENKEWELLRTTAARNEVRYECCPEPYLDIKYTLHLRRRNASHIQKVLLPSALLMFLSILSLLLPASQLSFRLFILFFTFLVICLGSSSVPQPSLMSTLLSSCTFTLLLLIMHTILVASLANSCTYFLTCSPIWLRRRIATKENQEEAFKAQAQKIAWWVDFAAFWVYLLCFGAYFTCTVYSKFPVGK